MRGRVGDTHPYRSKVEPATPSETVGNRMTAPRHSLTPPEHEPGSDAAQARGSRWRIASAALVIAFAGGQILDFVTAQGLASTEPKGYFAEANPLLAQITDPVIRAYVGFALKVAAVIFVVWVAKMQRRRAVGTALLLLGTIAGLFGTWSNMNPWR
jgi:uncharacterized membrane protein YsdA (DUF1294 family)